MFLGKLKILRFRVNIKFKANIMRQQTAAQPNRENDNYLVPASKLANMRDIEERRRLMKYGVASKSVWDS